MRSSRSCPLLAGSAYARRSVRPVASAPRQPSAGTGSTARCAQAQQAAGPTLGELGTCPHCHHGVALCLRAQRFPRATTFSASLSSIASQHLLELCVLRLQRREPLAVGHIKAAEIAAPRVEGGIAETVLEASLLDRVRAAACVRKPIICSSVKSFLISVLGLGTDST